MLVKEFVPMHEHRSRNMDVVYWAPATRSTQASETKPLQLITKETTKPGLEWQKAKSFVQIELQHTQVQPVILP